MMSDDEPLEELDQLIRAYLHQDMELDAPGVPQAIARFSRLNDAVTKEKLEAAMQEFSRRYHNNAEAVFEQRYGDDFVPAELGQSVEQFFQMVRELLVDPESHVRFDGTSPR